MKKDKVQSNTPFPFLVPTPHETELDPRILISVVLPVFNHGEFLADSIESVLSQKGVNLELIVVNDGSTDSTANVLATFNDEKRISIIEQENAGLPRALSRGFREARGDFLTWTSADNRYAEGALQRLAAFLFYNPSVVLTYADVLLIDENGSPLVDSSYRVQDQNPANSAHLRLPRNGDSLSQINDNFINACFMYRNEIQHLTPCYNPDSLGFEDYEYWLKASVFGQVAHCGHSKALYHYRLHSNSMTAHSSSDALSAAQAAQVDATQMLQARIDACTVVPTAASQKKKFSITRLGQSEGRNNKELSPSSIFSRYTSDDHLKQGPLLDRTSQNQRRVLAIRPAFKPPLGLRRARDSNYQAITPTSPDHPVAVIFVPEYPDEASVEAKRHVDWQIQSCRDLVEKSPNMTFALFCTNQQQRVTADLINVNLDSNHNFRIVDASQEFAERSQSSFASAADLTLLYSLSSADLIVSIKTPRLELPEMEEIRVESLLAACAGIPIALFSESWGTAVCPETQDLYHLLNSLPHLALFRQPEELETLAHREILTEKIGNSLEQYIQSQSALSILKKSMAFTGV